MNKRKNINYLFARHQEELLHESQILDERDKIDKESVSLEKESISLECLESTDSIAIPIVEVNKPKKELTSKVVDFDREVANLYPWLLHLAKWYCSSLEDAEDLAGDTICKLLANRDKFQNSKPLKPWCNTVLINTYFTMFKKNSLISFVSYDFLNNVSSAFNPFNNLCYKELLSVIQKCAKHTKCMNSLLLHIQGFSYEEISLSLDIPIGTVRSRISFARKVLAQELEFKK